MDSVMQKRVVFAVVVAVRGVAVSRVSIVGIGKKGTRISDRSAR